MKMPEWVKELREWLSMTALLVIAVLFLLYLPDLAHKFTEGERNQRKEREAMQRFLEMTPEERAARQEVIKKSLREKGTPKGDGGELGEK